MHRVVSRNLLKLNGFSDFQYFSSLAIPAPIVKPEVQATGVSIILISMLNILPFLHCDPSICFVFLQHNGWRKSITKLNEENIIRKKY